jgi:hypothetical protein
MHIYWDLDNHTFVKSLTDSQIVDALSLVLRDQVSITLHTVRPSTASGVYFAEEDCPAGKAPLFGIKGTTQAKLAGAYLATQAVWTRTATGQYTAVVDLNTTELIAEIGTETTVDLKAEFALVDVDGKHYDSTQCDLTVDYDVNVGGEAAAESVYVGNNSIIREELIGGKKVLILYNSDGIEYGRFNPPGA